MFHAHNLGIELLLHGAMAPGLHPFPAFLADEIVAAWSGCFGEDIPGRPRSQAPHLTMATG